MDVALSLQVALRIRPLTNEEKAQGRRIVAEKVDDKVKKKAISLFLKLYSI